MLEEGLVFIEDPLCTSCSSFSSKKDHPLSTQLLALWTRGLGGSGLRVQTFWGYPDFLMAHYRPYHPLCLILVNSQYVTFGFSSKYTFCLLCPWQKTRKSKHSKNVVLNILPVFVSTYLFVISIAFGDFQLPKIKY